MGQNVRVSVIGGGSWATALVKILSNNVLHINWWLRKEESVKHIKEFKRNPRYLSDVVINTDIVNLFTDVEECIKESEIVILAVPSAFLKDSLVNINSEHLKNKKVFSAVKGIIPENLVIVGEFVHQEFSVPYENIGVISGPCHSEEVALEKLSYLTISCQNEKNTHELAELMRCRYIKVTESDDIYGTEYGAVLKNVYAIAAGLANGVGYGDNFQAVLMSNAIREMKRFVDAVHPINRDINDSAYLGDLLVTSYSQFSRNRTLGNMIGRGYTVKSAMMEMGMIAEGYYSVKCVYELNKKYKVDMPICEAVFNVLYDNISPRMEMKLLTDQLN
ncbi:MAG: NAD(P)H-dependent glycerol-3-phosphate dehydrogenase [Bacteroidia bacterium]|nr:NAD(P)H-dependent glycerol-3-phosphate dehydrogenase [Bacteroidia bacterium]